LGRGSFSITQAGASSHCSGMCVGVLFQRGGRRKPGAGRVARR